MAIRVIIEREVDAGNEVKLQQLLTQLRSKAIQAKGYISGETLRSLSNPHKFLVISTWNSVEDWKAWENDPDRQQLQDSLKRLLRSGETSTIYGHL